MPTTAEKVAAFRRLHRPGAPFIVANAWDAGSARILQGLGAKALATTSSGFALTLGRKDYGVAGEEALTHCRLVAGGVDIPVSADLENGFGLSPEDAAATIRTASETGLAGGSIEDSSRDADDPIIDKSLAIAHRGRRRSRARVKQRPVSRWAVRSLSALTDRSSKQPK
jgi:2-methylisocitrate lyase-like PEP mutase family enzyme